MPITVDPHVAVTWIERVAGGSRERTRDEVAIEEPLEIRVDGNPLAVTMRTPGHDDELAAGFLAGEGLIGGAADLVEIGLTEDLAANTIAVRTASGLRRDPADERRFHLSSSCGVCRKAALEHVRVAMPSSPARPSRPIESQVVLRLPGKSRRAQEAFERTGVLHAWHCSSPAASLWCCARTWDATTRWTRRSARCCSPGATRCRAWWPASADG